MICTKHFKGCQGTCKGETPFGICAMCVQVMVGNITPEQKKQAMNEYRQWKREQGNRRGRR